MVHTKKNEKGCLGHCLGEQDWLEEEGCGDLLGREDCPGNHLKRLKEVARRGYMLGRAKTATTKCFGSKSDQAQRHFRRSIYHWNEQEKKILRRVSMDSVLV